MKGGGCHLHGVIRVEGFEALGPLAETGSRTWVPLFKTEPPEATLRGLPSGVAVQEAGLGPKGLWAPRGNRAGSGPYPSSAPSSHRVNVERPDLPDLLDSPVLP